MNEYDKILQKLITKSNKDLISVLNVGSHVRGDSDDLSDYDFILIWENLQNHIWQEGACRINGKKCGIRNITYHNLDNHNWTQLERHSFSFSKIEYDPNNLMQNIIKRKCMWEKDERLSLFCELLFELS